MKSFRHIMVTVALTSAVVVSVLAVPQSAAAYDYEVYPAGFKILPECALVDGNCNADDLIQMFVNLAAVGLKILPYVTMVMVIWAGFNLIMAGGNPTKIQEGKKMVGSILMGIIIILFLAWAWAYFIVFIMTCDPNAEKGCNASVFGGYGIWEREWWGGGEGVLITPTEGCCTVDGIGCEYTDEASCTEYRRLSGQTASFSQGVACSQHANPCDQYRNQSTCCVPTAPPTDPPTAKTSCQQADPLLGCLDVARTHVWDPNQCERLDRCKPEFSL